MAHELKEGRYIMYLRKSRADVEKEKRGHFETLAKHEHDLIDLARRDGYPIDEIYRELVCGESVAERPEFQKVMQEIQERRVTGVLVHHTDRLGRGDMMEFGWILSTLQYTQTLVITPAKVFDPTDRMDYQQLQYQMFFSNNEFSEIRRRMMDGKARAVKDGAYIGCLSPFGYDKVERDGVKTLEPNEHAVVVREAYQSLAAGKTTSEVARSLNSRGILTVHGREWSPARVFSLVSNPLYKGYVTWGKRVLQIDSREGMEFVKRRVKGSDPIIAKGLHPAIVSEELWQQAFDAIQPSHRAKKGMALKNPLAGVLRCAKCGKTMNYTEQKSKGRRYGYYRHNVYSSCSAQPARAYEVFDLVLESLWSCMRDLDVKISEGVDPHADYEAEAKLLSGELEACERKIKRVIELYSLEEISIEEFRASRDPLLQQAANLRARIKELQSLTPRDPVEQRASLHELIECLGDESIPCEVRNASLKAVVEKIAYTREERADKIQLEITLRSF